jgi:hypothetical protein
MASTEEKRLAPSHGDESPSPGENARGEERHRAREILAEQRSQLDRLENELTEQLQHLADEVAQSVQLAETVAGQTGESAALTALQAQFDALKQQFAALDAENERLGKVLEEAQLRQGRAEQELRVREALLKDTQANDEARAVEMAAVRQRLAEVEAQLAAAQKRHAELESELSEAREQVAAEQEATKAQRRRIAREFKQHRAERLEEFDRRKAELLSLEQARCAAVAGNADAAQADAARAELLAAAQQRAEALESEIDRLRASLELVDGEHARELEALRSAAPIEGDHVELATLRAERDDLSAQLALAEARSKDQESAGEAGTREKGDLQRRFEMAVEEVRELKRANAELEVKLKSRPGTAVPAISGGGMDWEAQKQRLLESLEADGNDDEDAVAERTNIEATIRITDQIVAQKDREIAELKLLLEQQSASAGAYSAGVNAELFDHDEVILQERNRLLEAQKEWRDKIGKAEIDVSVERAKVGRERAELEEKIRQFQAEQERRDSAADPNLPTKGRWLARLGLKDIDEAGDGRGKK